MILKNLTPHPVNLYSSDRKSMLMRFKPCRSKDLARLDSESVGIEFANIETEMCRTTVTINDHIVDEFIHSNLFKVDYLVDLFGIDYTNMLADYDNGWLSFIVYSYGDVYNEAIIKFGQIVCKISCKFVKISVKFPVKQMVVVTVVNLPAPKEGVGYIVSTQVAIEAAKLGRTDVYSPDTVGGIVRNGNNEIVGTTNFQRFLNVG